MVKTTNLWRYGYGSIPTNTIFRGMNIHKSQLFWCELQGYKVLTHCHISQSFLATKKASALLEELLARHSRQLPPFSAGPEGFWGWIAWMMLVLWFHWICTVHINIYIYITYYYYILYIYVYIWLHFFSLAVLHQSCLANLFLDSQSSSRSSSHCCWSWPKR